MKRSVILVLAALAVSGCEAPSVAYKHQRTCVRVLDMAESRPDSLFVLDTMKVGNLLCRERVVLIGGRR